MHSSELARVIRYLVALAAVAGMLWVAACDDGGGDGDADGDGDGDADGDGDGDADADADGDSEYPPLDCGDHPDNMVSCMTHLPEPLPQDGIMCGGECNPICIEPLECPEGWICHRAGVNGVCFPEE